MKVTVCERYVDAQRLPIAPSEPNSALSPACAHVHVIGSHCEPCRERRRDYTPEKQAAHLEQLLAEVGTW